MNRLIHENAIKEMNRVFDADAGLFYIIKQNDIGLNFESPLFIGVDQNFQKQYEQNYWQFDPFINEAIGSNQPVLGCSYNYPGDKWFDLQYYKKFLQPQNIDYELAIYIRENDKVIGGMAALRSKGHPQFEENDLVKAKLLLPYINQVIHDYLSLETDCCNKQSQTAWECSDQGIILLDANLQFMGYNSTGIECYLSLNEPKPSWQQGLDQHPLHIPPEIIQDCQELKRLYDNRLFFACIPRRRVFINKNNKIVDTTCNIISSCLSASSEYYLLISIKDSLKIAHNDLDSIRREEKITTREMHIVQLAACGYTNKQIAQNLFLSPFTIENHMKHIFAKIKIKNRTELANWLLKRANESQAQYIIQSEPSSYTQKEPQHS